jgi:rhodanese-related sulfurtransferase/DNA-binding transcriptional ArsR family regulator
MEKRTIKDILYEQVARIGKATSSPKRLELLELLAQGEKSVEVMADELSIAIKLASAHLKVLKEARLVTARKDGKFVYYRLAGQDVGDLWVAMREVAQEHLVELRVALDQIASAPDKLASCSRKQLMEQAKRGEIIVIDVRPRAEFDHAHLPFARSMPLEEIVQRMAELPKNTEIVAYCRGPFCLFAEEAALLLKTRGRKVSKLLDGVAEWTSAGMPLEMKKSP